MTPTILLVESEPTHREALGAFLRREGFDVCAVKSGVEALAGCPACVFDIVLLNAALPDLSGIEVCRKIRAGSAVPIIMVSAEHGPDPAHALEVGADDCIMKPIRLRELVARLRAQLRRSPGAGGPPALPTVLKVGNVRLDAGTGGVLIAGQPVHLPRKELAVLAMLLAEPDQVVRRELIMDQVWGSDWGSNSKTLDAHIKRLRERLAEAGAEAEITTIRGLGYRYEDLARDAPGLSLDLTAEEDRVVIDLATRKATMVGRLASTGERAADQP